MHSISSGYGHSFQSRMQVVYIQWHFLLSIFCPQSQCPQIAWLFHVVLAVWHSDSLVRCI